MIKKILESAGLVLLNIVGLCVGIILGLLFVQDVSGVQDNHFLGGLVLLVEMIIQFIIGVVIGVGSTLVITAAYILIRIRKKH